MSDRLIDGSIVEAYRSSRRPIDRAALASLEDLIGLPGCDTAVPLMPSGAYGHELAAAWTERAAVIEPLGASLQTIEATSPTPRGAVIVDPATRPLDGAPLPDPRPPDAADTVREHCAWVPTHLRDDDLVATLRVALNALPEGDRLRIIDPFGMLRVTHAAAIARIPDAARLTIAPENRHREADAIAALLLAAADGPRVRATLLGHGPRSGHAATELHTPATDAARLQQAAERYALIRNEPIPVQHPLWGEPLTPEPELLGPAARPAWNAATLRILLDEALADHGLEPTPAERDRLTGLLAERLRPGDAPDGPALYAFLATHMDLLGDRTTKDLP